MLLVIALVGVLMFVAAASLGYSISKGQPKPPPTPKPVNVITPQVLTCKKLVNSLLESQRQYAQSVELLVKALNQQTDTGKFNVKLLSKVNDNVHEVNGRLKFTNPLIKECVND